MSDTTYTDSALSDMIKQFLQSFKKDGRYLYVEKIDGMMPNGTASITVSYTDFATHSNLEKRFREEPDLILEVFARAIKEILQQRYPSYAESIKDDIAVKITHYPIKNTVRQINSKNTGQFITIKAMLIRMSAVESIPKIAVYQCANNHTHTITAKKDYTIRIPIICNNPKCKSRDFEIIPQRSKFADYQILQLQELPGELPAGKLPKTLGVFVSGDLVDSARMGDTVEISGIVRPEISKEIKLGVPVQTYRHRLYANNIVQLANEHDFGGKITDEEITQITSMIHDISEEKASTLIINSFAPHIYGHTLIKEALILTMIGSDSQTLQDGTKIRGDINIFLVGDPGTAKSEMGKAAYMVAPRAFYTSGRGTSGVGLTAATIKDNITGIYMLEPGITVLADQGTAIIDEFDKMRPEDRSALHEVMEQQCVSISKGGITATLNARTSIIAIANPTYGRYDSFRNLTDNIPSIPIPLLTRFDMIFVIRDIPEKQKDQKIARHIISAHNNNLTHQKNFMDMETFAKYLRIAKNIHPKLSTAAEEKIINYYIKMRNTDDESGYTITPRQLEGLIRLSMSRAKFLLKNTADEDDADRAIHIIHEMFKSSGVDVNTGKVDIGVLEGRPQSEKGKIQLFQDIMKVLEDQLGPVPGKTLVEELVKSGKFTDVEANTYIKRFLQEANIWESSPGCFRKVSGY